MTAGGTAIASKYTGVLADEQIRDACAAALADNKVRWTPSRQYCTVYTDYGPYTFRVEALWEAGMLKKGGEQA